MINMRVANQMNLTLATRERPLQSAMEAFRHSITTMDFFGQEKNQHNASKLDIIVRRYSGIVQPRANHLAAVENDRTRGNIEIAFGLQEERRSWIITALYSP